MSLRKTHNNILIYRNQVIYSGMNLTRTIMQYEEYKSGRHHSDIRNDYVHGYERNTSNTLVKLNITVYN